jgi:hypothetical protein
VEGVAGDAESCEGLIVKSGSARSCRRSSLVPRAIESTSLVARTHKPIVKPLRMAVQPGNLAALWNCSTGCNAS